MATRLTTTEVSRNFAAVLTRVDGDEEIEVVRDGVPIARIAGVPADGAVSANRLRTLFGGSSRLDPTFADDLTAARRSLTPARDRWVPDAAAAKGGS